MSRNRQVGESASLSLSGFWLHRQSILSSNPPNETPCIYGLSARSSLSERIMAPLGVSSTRYDGVLSWFRYRPWRLPHLRSLVTTGANGDPVLGQTYKKRRPRNMTFSVSFCTYHDNMADLLGIARPGFVSCIIALVVEIPICIALSLRGMEEFAYYLSGSQEVASITAKMWQVSNLRQLLVLQ